MKYVRKTIALIAALALIVSCLGTVSAASEIEPMASPTLCAYLVTLAPGSKSGELRVTFDITATGIADSLGVSTIDIYKNGTHVEMIDGSTDNKLISSGPSYTYTYPYLKAIPNEQYYAIVTIFARIGNDFDCRILKTATVTAP